MMTVDLDTKDLHDIGALMRLAQKQCQFRLYTLAQNGMRRTQEGKTVENALCGAITYAEKFEALYGEAAK